MYPFTYIILGELYTIGSKVTKMAIKVDRIRHARINKDIPKSTMILKYSILNLKGHFSRKLNCLES